MEKYCYILITQAKENGKLNSTMVDCYANYEDAKKELDGRVESQTILEDNCQIVEKYDHEVHTYQAEPFINGFHVDKVLYFVSTISGNSFFPNIVFTMDRFIVKQKFHENYDF